jgi:hypothetical protein
MPLKRIMYISNLSFVGSPAGLMNYLNNEVEEFEFERMESIKQDCESELQND